MRGPLRPTWHRSLVLATGVWLCSLGCESIVGIHPSRELAGAGPLPSLGGGEPLPPSDRPSNTLPGSGAGTGALGESGLPSDGPVLLQPPGVDDPADDSSGESDPVVDAGMTPGDESATPVDAGKTPVEDGPGDEPDRCEPVVAPAPTLEGTVFVFSAGPNSGSADAVGLCSFPNDELPRAPRFYGAVERELMSGPAALCGACLRASHRANTVDITIIDVIESNPLARGATLAMDVGAMRALSEAGGNLDVRFAVVPCEDVGTIVVEFVSASDPSVSFIGHRNALSAVRLVTSSGATVGLTRQEYNYWTPPAGFSHGGGLVSLILEDDLGNELVLSDLEVGADIDTGRQFPPPAPACPVLQ